jgi:hypothetical protein
MSWAGNARRTPRSCRATPSLEALEDRTVPQATPQTDPFLFTPIPETTPLAMHIHVHLTILINGHKQVIPANIGARLPLGFLPLHTHDASGIIHVESSLVRTFHLDDFFAIGGQTFNRHEILGRTTNRNQRITMTVDGRVTHQFQNWVLHEHDDIVISFGPKSAPLPKVPPFKFPSGF